MIQLLDIKIDVIFKDFFGSKTHKEVLESFINSVLGLTGDSVIEVEELLDPRKMRVEVGKPTTFIDISVKTRCGERYIIEMQTYNHEGLDKRLLYYLGKDYTEQLDYLKKVEAQDTTKKQVGWRDLPKVHVIAIADFHRSKAKKDGILNGNTVTETYAFRPECDQTNNHLFDQWKATLVDLKKFADKPFEELRKYKDWWLFLLKNASRFKQEEIERLKKDPIFKVAIERLEHLSSDPKTRKAYEQSLNEQRNLTAIKQASIKEGHEEGLKKGRKEGREQGLKEGKEKGREQGLKEGEEKGREQGLKEGEEKGREQGLKEGEEKGREQGLKEGEEKGREEGLEEGRNRKAIEIAKSMLENGIPPVKVAEMTKLELKQVQSLEQANLLKS